MKLLFVILTTIFTFAVSAAQIHSYTGIKVNPSKNSDHVITASVHLVWENEFVDHEDSLAANEIISKVLKLLRVDEVVDSYVIDKIKHNTLRALTEEKGIKSNKVTAVYVTDVKVEYTGSNRVILLNKREKQRTES